MSLHAQARTVLAGWTPQDPLSADEQAALRDEYVAFLDQHDDALRRECSPGHLTASALVLSADRSSVLLTLHAKVGRWLQMGGHCEDDDGTLREAAAREAREESGIAGLVLSTEPLRVDRHWVGCGGGAWHLDVQYLAMAPPGAVEVISAESLALAWWPVHALPGDSDDALRHLVATALARPG